MTQILITMLAIASLATAGSPSPLRADQVEVNDHPAFGAARFEKKMSAKVVPAKDLPKDYVYTPFHGDQGVLLATCPHGYCWSCPGSYCTRVCCP